MFRKIASVALVSALAVVPASVGFGVSTVHSGEDYATLATLGEALFNDPNLSMNRTQACATCHMDGFAFSDPRENDGTGRDVSLGDNGSSLGDRNTPTALYARFSPPFSRNDAGEYVGGQFWDGRALGLEEQAGGPPINPVEMGMPDKASVVARIRENPDYVAAFGTQFGGDIFQSDDEAYTAMTKALAAFQRTDAFSTFDSKYDRALRGEEKLTDQEELGRVLFFSQQFTNCNVCHEVRGPGGLADGTFTNHKYFNIGIPENTRVRKANGGSVDTGLALNPMVAGDPAQRGKFKVPSLRNVAVTAPYMHNGVFQDLRTTVLFYVKYNSKKKSRQINPETGQPWAAPEVPDNIAMTELTSGPALDDKRVDAVVAFLKTLTDKRFEHLIPKDETGSQERIGQDPLPSPAQTVGVTPKVP